MKSIISYTVSVLVASLPVLAHAQDEPAAPPVPAQPPAAGPTVEALQAELQQVKARQADELKELRADMAEREKTAAEESDRRIHIYGFADFGMQKVIQRDDNYSQSMYSSPLSFYLGRLNLYFDGRPDPDFRFLVETRLSLYPQGSVTAGQTTPTSTTIADTSSPNPWAYTSWGSIILERAVLDYTRYQFLSVRVGMFLTPFGIYNVDHGSPALISLALPAYLTLGWLPNRQLGVQLFGSVPVDRWELGYAATVGNGQSANGGIRDIGNGKALGGRVFARRQGQLQLLLGGSALYRPFLHDVAATGFENGAMTYRISHDVERDDLTLGLDQSLDYGGLRIRNEVVYYKVKYKEGKRDNPMGFGLSPNSRQVNTFTLVAYRYWKVEPYVQFNYFHSSPDSFYTNTYVPGAGFNVYLRPNVILKAQWIYIRFQKDNDVGNSAVNSSPHIFNALLVWAF